MYFLSMMISLLSCTSHESNKKVNFGVLHPLKNDTLTKGMRTGKYYSPYIIRLDIGFKNAFIRIDTNYAGTPLLLKGKREDYYKRALAEIPAQDLKMQRQIWKIKELQALQHGDGGYGTLFTVIKDRPSKTNHAWVFEVHENQLMDMPLSSEIAYIRIDTKTCKIEIATASEYYVPMDRWRKVIR